MIEAKDERTSGWYVKYFLKEIKSSESIVLRANISKLENLLYKCIEIFDIDKPKA